MWVPPKSSILMGFSPINQPFGGTTIPGNLHLLVFELFIQGIVHSIHGIIPYIGYHLHMSCFHFFHCRIACCLRPVRLSRSAGAAGKQNQGLCRAVHRRPAPVWGLKGPHGGSWNQGGYPNWPFLELWLVLPHCLLCKNIGAWMADLSCVWIMFVGPLWSCFFWIVRTCSSWRQKQPFPNTLRCCKSYSLGNNSRRPPTYSPCVSSCILLLATPLFNSHTPFHYSKDSLNTFNTCSPMYVWA